MDAPIGGSVVRSSRIVFDALQYHQCTGHTWVYRRSDGAGILAARGTGSTGYRVDRLFSVASGAGRKTRLMKTQSKCVTRFLALLMSIYTLPGIAQATPYLDGTVAYDYYVAGVDDDGFEWVDAGMYAQSVVNDSGSWSGPLSMAGWLTPTRSPTGSGVEAGYLPIGSLAPNSQAEINDTVAADDVRPGEYFVNMLLQDDRYPGTWEDSRELPPTLLWRGGLEAIGPLRIYQYNSGRVDVDFDRLENRRLDGRYSNSLVLRLLATYGFGPASDGLVLCEKVVSGMYSGDSRLSAGFSCYPDVSINGEFTLHLEVAESGGRGGYSTLTGPDAYFQDGWIERFYGCNDCFSDSPYGHDTVYYAGGMAIWTLFPLLLAGVMQARRGLRLLAVALLLPFAAIAAPTADYTDAELDQLLAPIALYPDTVLSNVLIAATYPLEVAQAARWVHEHDNLETDAALAAVEKRNWDESVKALVAYPEILERMDEDLDWTQDLGEAFLAQDEAVMDRIQVLRRRADDTGSLDDPERVQVVREREIIYIEPAVTGRMYIPYYDPWVVYGNWWWPAYPPHHWSYWAGHPVAYYSGHYSPFYWGAWVAISPGFYFSAFNWHRHHVVVVPHHYQRHGYYRARDVARYEGAQRWQHDAGHRRQVEYRHQRLSHRSDDNRTQRRETLDRGNYRQRSTRTDAAPNSTPRRVQRQQSRPNGTTGATAGKNRSSRQPTPGQHDAKSRPQSDRNKSDRRGAAPPAHSPRRQDSVERAPTRSQPSERSADDANATEGRSRPYREPSSRGGASREQRGGERRQSRNDSSRDSRR